MTVTRNPLDSLTRLVRVLWAVTGAGSLLGAVMFGFGASSFSVCVDSVIGAERIDTDDLPGDTGSTSVAVGKFCVLEPDAWDRVLGTINLALPGVGYAVTFFLLLRLLQLTSRDGIHSETTADRVRRFGWFVLVAMPLVSVLTVAARAVLVHELLPDAVHVFSLLRDWQLPWWAVVTGFGLLALAKIMHTGAEMREDLEGTV